MKGILDGFEVIEKPTKYRRGRWNCYKILDEFLASGNECMGKRYGDDIHKVVYAFLQQLKRTPMPVSVHKRGDMLILVREEVDE